MKDVLNLNTELLRKNRRSMLTEVINKINSTCRKGKSWDKKILERFLKKYSEKHSEEDEEGTKEKYYPYCGIIIWYLQKKLRALD